MVLAPRPPADVPRGVRATPPPSVAAGERAGSSFHGEVRFQLIGLSNPSMRGTWGWPQLEQLPGFRPSRSAGRASPNARALRGRPRAPVRIGRARRRGCALRLLRSASLTHRRRPQSVPCRGASLGRESQGGTAERHRRAAAVAPASPSSPRSLRRPDPIKMWRSPPGSMNRGLSLPCSVGITRDGARDGGDEGRLLRDSSWRLAARGCGGAIRKYYRTGYIQGTLNAWASPTESHAWWALREEGGDGRAGASSTRGCVIFSLPPRSAGPPCSMCSGLRQPAASTWWRPREGDAVVGVDSRRGGQSRSCAHPSRTPSTGGQQRRLRSGASRRACAFADAPFGVVNCFSAIGARGVGEQDPGRLSRASRSAFNPAGGFQIYQQYGPNGVGILVRRGTTRSSGRLFSLPERRGDCTLRHRGAGPPSTCGDAAAASRRVAS
jgi:hypothetical protein